MRPTHSSEDLLNIVTSILKERHTNRSATGEFFRWIGTHSISQKTNWIKRKVRYEFDKLVDDGLLESTKPPGSVKMYSLPSFPNCVRFGDYFKETTVITEN